MMSDFVTAVTALLSESFLLIALRALILAAVVKISFEFARNRSPLVLASLLWLAVFLFIVMVNDGTSAIRLFVRFETLFFAGAVIGIGAAAYARLLGLWQH